MNETDLSAHFTTSAMVVYALQALKQAGWCPWVTADSKTVNRILSAVMAAALAFGITATGDAQTGWVVQIPSATVLLSGLWHWAEQFTSQQILYDLVAQKSGTGKGVTT